MSRSFGIDIPLPDPEAIMHFAATPWITFALATVAYWTLLVLGWILRSRREARASMPMSLTRAPDGRVSATFTESIDLRKVGALLFGPPLLLALLLFVRV